MGLRQAIWKRTPRAAFSMLSHLDGTHAELAAFMRDHQLGLFETLERVRRDRLSLARFGDGELELARRPGAMIAYQHGSPELSAELRAILSGEADAAVPLLVCIPGINVPYYRSWWAKYWRVQKPLLNPARTYGNTSVSREGLFSLDPERACAAWRAIWDGRDVCYVVGKGSRFEPVPALFDNVASERTIASLPREAYADVPRLVAEIEATIPRDTLLLISLGPAATVLAARLARHGRQALDIGHISSAWRTVAEGAPAAEKTPLVAGG